MTQELSQRSYRGQRIVVSDDGQGRVFLGPHLHLIDCELVFQCAPPSIEIGRAHV